MGNQAAYHNLPGELARVKSIESNDDWPYMIEIVAYWGDSRKGKCRRLQISADHFFGRGDYGAPLTGDQLIGMIDRLRRQGPERK
jgi:hypothetical protein